MSERLHRIRTRSSIVGLFAGGLTHALVQNRSVRRTRLCDTRRHHWSGCRRDGPDLSRYWPVGASFVR